MDEQNGAQLSHHQSKQSESEKVTSIVYERSASWLEWLLGTEVTVEQFFAEYWEKKPLLVRKQHRTKAYPTNSVTAKLPADALNDSTLFTKVDLHKILTERKLEYKTDLNVCRYVNGKRDNLNSNGRATSEEIGKLYNEGCTIQFFQPQRYSDVLHSLMASMESHFGSAAGANVYLTPPNSQGLSPHYDNVEVFILQTEGKKHWLLYSPPEKEILPFKYSRELAQAELPEPLLEAVLSPGDFLYFPRGMIHQARASADASTHITFSTYERTSWADYLRVALPFALERAMEEDLDFRRGLPLNFHSYMGVAFKPDDDGDDKYLTASIQPEKEKQEITQALINTQKKDKDPRQEEFRKKVGELVGRLPQYLRLHEAADEFVEEFVAHRLPPVDSPFFQPRHIEVNDDSLVRLYDPSWLRLIIPHPDQDDLYPALEAPSVGIDDDLTANGKGKEAEKEIEKEREKEMEIKNQNEKENGNGNGNENRNADNQDHSQRSEKRYDGTEGTVILMHSLGNSRSLHMGPRMRGRSLALPDSYHSALVTLWRAYPEYVPLRSLPLSPESRPSFVVGLLREGVLQLPAQTPAAQ